MADIRLAKPAAGASQSIPCEPEARFIFDFPTTDATLARDGDNLNIRFEDGSNLELQGFYQQYNEENLPSFNIDGTEVAAADFFQAMNEPDLMPAAGPGTGTVANGARFHEWGDSALTGGIEHLNGLDWGFSRAFEWEDHPNAVGYTHDDDPGVPGNTVPDIEIPGRDPDPNDGGKHFVAAQGGNIVVDEGALDAGSKLHTYHGTGNEGFFTVDVHDEKGGSIELAFDNDVLVLDIPRGGATSITVPEDAPVFHINGVDITILGATSDGNGKWTVSYTYKLTESVEHNKNLDEDTVRLDPNGLSITVTDGSGDVAEGKLTVEVHDDVPTLSLDETSFKDVTSGTTATTIGHLSFDFGADNGDGKSLSINGKEIDLTPGAETKIEGEHGYLTVKADGSYTYTAKSDTEGEDTFNFRIVDSDGDEVTADASGNPLNLTVVVKKPEGPDPVEVTVKEEDLADGSNPDDTVADVAVTVPGYTILGVVTDGQLGSVTQGEDGGWNYTLKDNIDHAAGQGKNTASGADTVTLKVQDADGNTFNVDVKVNVVDDTPELHATDLRYNFSVEHNDYLAYTGEGFNFRSDTTGNLTEKAPEDGKFLLSGFSNSDGEHASYIEPGGNDALGGASIRAVKVAYDVEDTGYTFGTHTSTFEHEIGDRLGVFWGYPNSSAKLLGEDDLIKDGPDTGWYEFAFDKGDTNAMIRVRIVDDHTIEWKYSQGGTWDENYDMSNGAFLPFAFGVVNQKTGWLADELIKIGDKTYTLDEDGLPIIKDTYTDGVILTWSDYNQGEEKFKIPGSGLCHNHQAEFMAGTTGDSRSGELSEAYGVEIDLNGQLAFGFKADLGTFYGGDERGDPAPEKVLFTFYRKDENGVEQVVKKVIRESDRTDGDWKGDEVGGYVDGGFDKVLITPLDNGSTSNDPSDFSLRGFDFITKPELSSEISGVIEAIPGADGVAKNSAWEVTLDLSAYIGKTVNVNGVERQWEYTKLDSAEILQLKDDTGTLFLAIFDHDTGKWTVTFSSTALEIDGKDIFELKFSITDSDGDTTELVQKVPLSEDAAKELSEYKPANTPDIPADDGGETGASGTEGNDALFAQGVTELVGDRSLGNIQEHHQEIAEQIDQ
ncbi:MAG: hypothetical protein HDQ92_07740, partial [Desulfovibrio sp.]|nr:hypothetical protein [Desulfovibrio sp.]